MQAVARGFVSQLRRIDFGWEKFRRWKRTIESVVTVRRCIFACILFLVIFLYAGPGLFSWLFYGSSSSMMSKRRHFDFFSSSKSPSMLRCDLSKKFRSDLMASNAYIIYHPSTDVDDQLPYVGNGYIGLTIDTTTVRDSPVFFVKNSNRIIDNPIPFSPIVDAFPSSIFNNGDFVGSTVINYLAGVVHRDMCYDDGTVVSSVVFAHRMFPSLLVQELTISNPTNRKVEFNLNRQDDNIWTGVEKTIKNLSFGGKSKRMVEYSLMSGHIMSSGSIVTILTTRIPPTILVNAGRSETILILTAVAMDSSSLRLSASNKGNLKSSLEDKVTQCVLKALDYSSKVLREQHEKIWKKLWISGFGISNSLAEGAINGLQINETIYYVLSQAPILVESLDENIFSKSVGCYSGISTLQATSLWQPFSSLSQINEVVNTWMITLEKNGCDSLIQTGVFGILQAMVLSFLGLKFVPQHLELNSHPKHLHRDIHIRRLLYGNSTRLNISVVVQPDNHALLFVLLDLTNQDFYACDAGCLDAPITLKKGTLYEFPIKQTNPLTAILYITPYQRHVQELKTAIHVSEIIHAPAHEHHVIALHRHGSHLGGLPGIFWISIGFLIFVFHVFLFKLIWQEYCSSSSERIARVRKYSDYY